MGKIEQVTSDFLFPEANYMLGAGSVLSLAGDYFAYNSCENGEEADSLALKADVTVVANDMKRTISSIDDPRLKNHD